jgi:YfiH family protein
MELELRYDRGLIWDCPKGVSHLVTTRYFEGKGVSKAPYDQFNVAIHVGDSIEAVMTNRAQLRSLLPSEPRWLNQVHGTEVVVVGHEHRDYRADAAITMTPGVVCVVQTADCLPILIADRQAKAVAAIHAGWRGLAEGVIEATFAQWPIASDKTIAWLGPAISAQVYEVGDEVREQMIERNAQAVSAFLPSRAGHWMCDLYTLARQRLNAMGVSQVVGSELCTYQDARRFYSFRREGRTGRMASMIWINP